MLNRILRQSLGKEKTAAVKPILGFIGAGNITNCLISGLIKSGYPPNSIVVSNRSRDKLSQLFDKFNIVTKDSNADVIESADIVLLALKPLIVKSVCLEVSKIVGDKNPLIISLVSATKLSDLYAWLNVDKLSIVRTMTNLSIEIGMGTSALFANSYLVPKEKELVASIFNAVGSSIWVKNESDLNTYSPLIGCGPAYLFLLLEALQKAAVERGIPKEQANTISLEMIRGASELALRQGTSAELLRQKVTTPNGITEHALQPLITGNIFGLFKQSFANGEKRCNEIECETNTPQVDHASNDETLPIFNQDRAIL